jgi:hypothetical protein
MIITGEQLRQIVAVGGGLVLDASAMTLNQIRDVIPAANTNKASITLKNLSGMTAGQLEEIAGLAPGLVTFDLSEQ